MDFVPPDGGIWRSPRFLRGWLCSLAIAVVVFLQQSMQTASMGLNPACIASSALQVNRSMFPPTFLFGTGTASYQVEGAYNVDGRGPSIWDVFSHTPGKVKNNGTGDVACDQYHLYQNDTALMVNMGVGAYRFSISWSRLFPEGSGTVNEAGIAYYNGLIDTLLSNGIEPWVTIYHWDLPQKLHETYGGWLSDHIVEDFRTYAQTCFQAFGDRVKRWITFNEPASFTRLGYGIGIHAPGCMDSNNRSSCTAGNGSAMAPPFSYISASVSNMYVAGHNALRAHAAAADVYRRLFQPIQNGTIGISLDSQWAFPMTDSPADVAAAERHMLFHFGWFLDPVLTGDYPGVMRERMGDALPIFTPEEKFMLNGSIDFVGLNFYTSRFVQDSPNDSSPGPGTSESPTDSNGQPIGQQSASTWLYVTPEGIKNQLVWIKNRYNSPIIYVTENGRDEEDNSTMPFTERLQDTWRVQYYNDYLLNVAEAIKQGADVRGYFAWSLLDNFEWAEGYTKRFGIYYVDFENGLTRNAKLSALCWQEFLKL